MSKLLTKIQTAKIKIGTITKELKNEFGGFSYASLNTVFRQVNDALEDVGILVDFESVVINPTLTEICKHIVYDYKVNVVDLETGETINKTFSFPADDEGKKMKLIQACGSCITYSTRYIYGSIFSIQFENDPDSSSAEQGSQKNNNKPGSNNTITSWLNPNTEEWSKTLAWCKAKKKSLDDAINLIEGLGISKKNRELFIEQLKAA